MRPIACSTALIVSILAAIPTMTQATQRTVSSRDPAWSPDGTRLAYVSDGTGTYEIYTIGVDGRDCRRVTNGGDPKFYAHFSPDGSRLVYLTWRQNGDTVHAGVWTVTVDGSDSRMVSDRRERTTDGSWARGADGRLRILFDVVRNGNDDIYIMDSDGGHQSRLTTNPSSEFTPVMSPDGKQIAFVTDRDGPEEIYVMQPDGSNQRNLTNDSLENLVPSWAPDSRRIVYYSHTPGQGNRTDELYMLDIRTGEKERLTHNDVRDFGPRWSPDGNSIAFSSMRSGQLEIHVMNLQTRTVRQVTSNGC